MAGNPRVLELLEEMLESGRTPEEVCRDCPELLAEVRRRWNEFRRIDEEVDALLPDPETHRDLAGPRRGSHTAALPQVPGYRVESVLGHGGMGIVYRAWHLGLDRPVALKMLLAGPHARPAELERFVREARAVAQLRHPNIVQVHDVGEVDGRPYFTMELLEGGDLDEQIRKLPQAPRQAAALVATLADAMQTAHQSGILHRDLKPANILLTTDGTPKVTDFGLARRLEGEGGLTLSGTPMGTPSYMAPEQAQADKRAIGPATDVYALGAILYELLTGRPPFRAATAASTVQQLLTEDPVPPARLNSRVPRDLQTICLKCLHKEPRKRYASAQALAEDLRRFERGEPIKARPVSTVERGVRWVRRRPALAAALACGLLLAAALLVTVVWWHGQRTALEATAVAYAEADLRESERLRDRGEFETSAAVLRRARDRLGEFVPPDLRDRLTTAFANLELVTRLDAIRLERALLKPPNDQLDVEVSPVVEVAAASVPGQTPSGQRYEATFRAGGIGAPGDDPAAVAVRVAASPVRGALVAALDDWAACAADPQQQAWVLAVVRQADPDPWRDRIRDPATWDNPQALGDLAVKAPVAQQSPQLLVVLGARLRARNLNAVPFLSRVVSAYPGDFWVNVEMGNALSHQKKPADAVGYYRTALALRPQTVSLRYVLGGLYLNQRRWDEAVAEYEQAIRLDPENPWAHNRLGFTLAWKGDGDAAIPRFREAVRLDPNLGWSHYFLAIALENKGSLAEAADEFRQTARLFPEKRTEARQRLRGLLFKQGRVADACAAWKEDLADRPPRHDDWFGYAELCLFLGDEAGYRRARSDLLAQFGTSTDPAIAERTGRACLLLPATAEELMQAAALADRAVAAGRPGREFAFPYFLFAQGLARYRQGRYDETIQLMSGEVERVMGPCPRLVLAMAQYHKGERELARKTLAGAVQSFDCSPAKADGHDAWIAHILRREAEALILADLRNALHGKP